MCYLENFTFYFRKKGGNRIIGDAFVQNEILLYMPQLHSFTFYISIYLINYCKKILVLDVEMWSVLSIILVQPRLYVYVSLCLFYLIISPSLAIDINALRHEFFVRMARSFPLLKHLSIYNIGPQPLPDLLASSSDHPQAYSVVRYSHLVSLNVILAYGDCLQQFLNETKTAKVKELTFFYNQIIQKITLIIFLRYKYVFVLFSSNKLKSHDHACD
jgi:hypothetical protein